MNESQKVMADYLLPTVIGNGVDTRRYREVFSLPVRDGGLDIMLPRDRDEDFQLFKAVSVSLEKHDPVELSQKQFLNQLKKDKSDNLEHKNSSIRLKLIDEEL